MNAWQCLFPRLTCFICLVLLVPLAHAADFEPAYTKGDAINPAVFVSDSDGSQVYLSTLFSSADINVLFIFGGGDLGAGLPGHLWCQDSFEDTAILRTLYGKYRDKGVSFIAVAEAPVFHSQMLGHKAGVFLTDDNASEDYLKAEQAFSQSTQTAVDSGILPFKPYLDARFRLMFNRSGDLAPREAYGTVHNWQGAFRASTETQFYGVPSFWIVDREGKILAEPFHGNLYHPHDTDVTINYTYRDIDQVLSSLL